MCLTCEINHVVACANYRHTEGEMLNMIHRTVGECRCDNDSDCECNRHNICQCGQIATYNILVCGKSREGILSYPITFSDV